MRAFWRAARCSASACSMADGDGAVLTSNRSSPFHRIGPPGTSPSSRSTHSTYSALPPLRYWVLRSTRWTSRPRSRACFSMSSTVPHLAGAHDLVLVEQEDRHPGGVDEL